MSLTCHYSAIVAKRKLHMQSIYLKPKVAQLLDRLAKATDVKKAQLLREAVDDLLVKHKMRKP